MPSKNPFKSLCFFNIRLHNVLINTKNTNIRIFLEPQHILSHILTSARFCITPAKHEEYHFSNGKLFKILLSTKYLKKIIIIIYVHLN